MKDVVADLQRPIPIAVEIGVSEHDGQFWICEDGQTIGGAAGCAIARDDSPQARVELAYWLQDQFFPETSGASGDARPECPSHTHPAIPSELDGEAWWVCPTDGRRIGHIGRSSFASS
jgi:hypothetical protein